MFSFPSALVPRSLAAGAAAVLLTVTLAGCGNTQPTGPIGIPSLAPTSSAAPTPAAKDEPHLTDYSDLLLQAGDLSDSEDSFAENSAAATPNGVPGASRLFVNAHDTRAISLTVAVYPGAPTAEATLREAVATSGTVLTGGQPQPLGVGTGGTLIRGVSPDGHKAITLVYFTHGNVLARLEFDSAPGDPTTDRFVTTIAKMQQIALRVGIPDSAE